MPSSAPAKHKAQNKYHFKTFAERLALVNVDAVHQIRRVIDDDEDSEDYSHFAECMKKWKDLDLSVNFAEFRKAVNGKCKNYRMVLHYRSEITDTLQLHLTVENTLALPALLELLVAICVDLSSDFYPSFSSFFEILIKLLKTRDVEKLEAIFTAMSMLFRHMWRLMVKDIESVLDMYTPLLTGEHPAHISSFAAESVSFLLRKCRQQQLVIKKIFSIVDKHPSSCQAVGKVLFFVVKSSQHHFHSCVESMLPVCLSFLTSNGLCCEDNGELATDRENHVDIISPKSSKSVVPASTEGRADRQSRIFEALSAAIGFMAEHTTKVHARPVWNILTTQLNKAANEKQDMLYTENLLKLLTSWCRVRRCARLVEYGDILKVVNLSLEFAACTNHEYSTSLCSTLYDLAAVVLLGTKSDLTPQQKEELLTDLCNSEHSISSLTPLWKSLFDAPDFDDFARNVFLKSCQRHLQKTATKYETIQLMCEFVCLRQELPVTAEQFSAYEPVALSFVGISRDPAVERPGKVVCDVLKDCEDLKTIWHCLAVCQHIRPVPKTLHKSIVTQLNRLLDDCSSEAALAAIAMAVQTLVVLGQATHLKTSGPALVKCLHEHPCSRHSLYFTALLLRQFPSVGTQVDSSLKEKLILNTSSHDSSIRQLSLRLLHLIDPHDVYELCIAIDLVPPTLHDYRSRLMQMSKLTKFRDDSESDINHVIVRFMLSNLTINFSALWPGVVDLLCDHKSKTKHDSFWKALVESLKLASHEAEQSGWWKVDKGAKTAPDLTDDAFLSYVKVCWMKQTQVVNLRFDIFNFRLQLWKALAALPQRDFVESYNRVLVELLFRFVEHEYYQIDTNQSPLQNLAASAEEKEQLTFRRKDAVVMLIAMLKVFSNFNNPSSAASTAKLRQLYDQLLAHLDPNLQRVALECILSYRSKSLLQYKEQLFDILDDKKFRDTLINFEVESIAQSDRVDLIPVLLRILYGRMRSKTGPSTGGKAMSAARRSVVIRFLGRMNESEILLFVGMITEPFSEILDQSLHIDAAVDKAVTLSRQTLRTVPLARQQGILATVGTLIDKLQHKLPVEAYFKFLRLLLSLTACHSAMIDGCTEAGQSDVVNKRFQPHLKNLRKTATECLTSLLVALPDPNTLSSIQVCTLFNVLVWPDMHKLKNESTGHPTMILKLFRCFFAEPKYRLYLVKRNSTASGGYSCALAAIVDTLVCPQTSQEVATFVLDSFILLLDESTEEKEEADVALSFTNSFSATGPLSHAVEVSAVATPKQFGLALLRPYLHDVVTYFVQRLRASKRGVTLMPKHLDFLSTVSEFVTDSSILSCLSEVMLGHVTSVCAKAQSQNDKIVLPALAVLSNVMRDTEFLPKLSKLFSKVSGRETRQMLVRVLCSACAGVDYMTWTCDIARRLNAWDKRFIEELDFDGRLTAFQDVGTKLRSDEFVDLCQNNCQQLTPVLHCVTHTLLNYYKDISLRESATRVLELLISRLKSFESDVSSMTWYRITVKELLLPAVETGLKSHDEGCRHESISLLSKLVKAFPTEPSIKNLSVLSNRTNPDDDFFENVRHIQIHRRARALRRLAKVIAPRVALHQSADASETALEEGSGSQAENPISYVAAAKYLMPIALQLLYGSDLSKHVHLKEACVDVAKACASIMPWPSYKRFLLQSIWAIKKQSNALEVVCAVLFVFPFDLRSLNDNNFPFNAEKNAVVDFPEVRDEKDKIGDVEMDVEPEADVEVAQALEASASEEAVAILNDVTKKIVPNLKQILSQKEDDQHKLSSTKEDIDQCRKKIPLAIAMVSALRHLPVSSMKRQLPGVLLKVIAFLRHKLHDVRIAASETMVKIASLLGVDFLPTLLRELRSGLSKGHQKHVLTSVVYAILHSLAAVVRVGEFDVFLGSILDILNEDLFGATAEEKTVEKLRIKIPEARGRSKAYPSYKILASFVGRGAITSLIEPLKKYLDDTHNHKVKKVAKNVFTEISLGLLDNKALTTSDFLTLTYGLLSDKTSALFFNSTRKETTSVVEQIVPRPLSLLLSKNPERYGTKATAKTIKTNSHLLTEFALQLLHSTMKRQLVSIAEHEHLEMLDPFVETLLHCLTSSHLQTVADACRCLARLFRAQLPAMERHGLEVTTALFKIMKDNTKGASNQELAAVCFKSLSVLCSTDYGKVMSEPQLKVLLTYGEEDLYSTQRQSHAFDLIKSVLKRGLQCDEVQEVIDKVRKISIQSHSEPSRAQARALYYHFLVNYPLTPKKLDNHLEFVLTQLNYEFEDGRASALEMLSSILTNFPLGFVLNHAGVVFLATSATLVNDESPKCRKMVAAVLKLLLSKVDEDQRNQLFSFVEHWYATEDLLQRRLAAMIISLYSGVEESRFQLHLGAVLPLLLQNIESAKSEGNEDGNNTSSDHSLFYHLSTFLAILRNCDVARSTKFNDDLSAIFDAVDALLLHPHAWVRLACCQIFGSLFSVYEPTELNSNHAVSGYLAKDTDQKLEMLSQHFCQQLEASALSNELSQQIVKNLLFVVKVFDSREQPPEAPIHSQILKLLKKMISLTKIEQAASPKETPRRSSVLKFCAAVAVTLKRTERVLRLLLEPVYRGLNASATHGPNEPKSIEDLRSLSAEVLEVVKSKVDPDEFSSAYLNVTRKIAHKRKERKREKAVQLVADPQRAAASKIRKHERTKLQRKRKLSKLRPEYGMKKRQKNV